MRKTGNESLKLSAVVLLAAGLGHGSLWFLCAEDWPQWGGNDPGRNMYSSETGLPARFDPGQFNPAKEQFDLATSQNVKWIAKLGSQSYGNVVVAGAKCSSARTMIRRAIRSTRAIAAICESNL